MSNPKQLVLQFRIDGHGTVIDFDHIVRVEDELDAALRTSRAGSVDGHDIGSGQMNIFLIVKNWEDGISFMEQYLSNQQWADAVILARRSDDGSSDVIWPRDFKGTFAIK